MSDYEARKDLRALCEGWLCRFSLWCEVVKEGNMNQAADKENQKDSKTEEGPDLFWELFELGY